VPNQVASIYELPPAWEGHYDAVTCWDVIEHLEDPVRALVHLKRCLKPGGYLFLSTPDAGSVIGRILGRHWYYLDPVQHIAVFNKKCLSMALQQLGYSITEYRTFGHYYCVKYVLARLGYLNKNNFLRHIAGLNHLLPEFCTNSHIYISLKDVIGVAAQAG
jgi:2-polyprenyl-3-methyl-5-hydroxy-6-metoxy-1,4-benzoquinol methylase